MKRYILFLVVPMGLLVSAACGGGSTPEPTPTVTPSATATAKAAPTATALPTATPLPPTPSPTPEASSVEAVIVADSPVGGQLSWVLEALNRDDLTEEEVASHFTSSFADRVSAAQVIAFFGQGRTAAEGGWTLARIEGETDTQMVALITAAGQEQVVQIVVEAGRASPDQETVVESRRASTTHPVRGRSFRRSSRQRHPG